MMTGQGMMADEDMEFLCAIAGRLAQDNPRYRVNLPNGAYITNVEGQNVSFAAIDAIKQAYDSIISMSGPNQRFELVMPSTNMKRCKIGEIFQMDLIADLDCPADKFLIQPIAT